MLTLRELLADKTYREYFTTPPPMPPLPCKVPPRWRLYIQRDSAGRWARKDFHTYKDAFRYLKPMLREVNDAAISSRGVSFPPPARVVRVTRGGKPVLDPATKKPVIKRIVWQPVIPEGEIAHRWCPYCRRPTIFAWFTRHHALGTVYDSSLTRCTICGASERLLNGSY